MTNIMGTIQLFICARMEFRNANFELYFAIKSSHKVHYSHQLQNLRINVSWR